MITITDLKKQIIEYSKLIGIDLIGFTSIFTSEELKEKQKKSIFLNYSSGFEKGNLGERLNPLFPINDFKTFIVIGVSYFKEHPIMLPKEADNAYFSNSSWGNDYHKVLNKKLDLLIDFIKNKDSNFAYFKQVDTGYFDERFIANQAGLGFFGKNNLLINEKYGSYFFIGLLGTNINFENDLPNIKNCDSCNLCINACPGKALSDIGILNAKKCLSYLTQKKELTITEETKINQTIYGCDICSLVCPHNKNVNFGNLDFTPTGVEKININDYKELSNKEWNNKYGHLSGSWRGKKVIERNIKIYQKNVKINIGVDKDEKKN